MWKHHSSCQSHYLGVQRHRGNSERKRSVITETNIINVRTEVETLNGGSLKMLMNTIDCYEISEVQLLQLAYLCLLFNEKATAAIPRIIGTHKWIC